MGFIFVIALAVLVACIWFYPIVRIAKSNRTEGGEKVAWVLITAFVFWFAWILYKLIAPIDGGKRRA